MYATFMILLLTKKCEKYKKYKLSSNYASHALNAQKKCPKNAQKISAL
jgi:hypothetical protein